MQEYTLSKEMQTKLNYMVEKCTNALKEELGVSIPRQAIEINVLCEIINELEEGYNELSRENEEMRGALG